MKIEIEPRFFNEMRRRISRTVKRLAVHERIVRIDAKKNLVGMTIAGNDGMTEMRTERFECHVETPGEACGWFDWLAGLKCSGKDSVRIEVGENDAAGEMFFRQGNYHRSAPCADPRDRFERTGDAREWGDHGMLSMSLGDFRFMLEATRKAAAIDDVRTYLNGIMMRREKKKSLLVATDGHRLHMAEAVDPGADIGEIIIPESIAADASPIIAKLDPDGCVILRFNTDTIALSMSDREGERTIHIVDRQPPSRFPAHWRKTLNEGKPVEFTVAADREAMIAAIKDAVDKPKQDYIMLTVKPDSIGVVREAGGADEVSVPASGFIAGEAGSVRKCFNAQYIIDALSDVGAFRFDLLGFEREIVVQFNTDIKVARVVMAAREDKS